jgi:hypothetical protein
MDKAITTQLQSNYKVFYHKCNNDIKKNSYIINNMMIRYAGFKKLDFGRFISRSIFSYKDPFLLEKQITDDEKSIKEV